jgi:hypothetical protein
LCYGCVDSSQGMPEVVNLSMFQAKKRMSPD